MSKKERTAARMIRCTPSTKQMIERYRKVLGAYFRDGDAMSRGIADSIEMQWTESQLIEHAIRYAEEKFKK
jgi:hypothetical protein